jgi:hypothetical protein
MTNDNSDIHSYSVGRIDRNPSVEDKRRQAGVYIAAYAQRTAKTKARRAETCRELLAILGLIDDVNPLQPKPKPSE